jgi:hypothetical protein
LFQRGSNFFRICVEFGVFFCGCFFFLWNILFFFSKWIWKYIDDPIEYYFVEFHQLFWSTCINKGKLLKEKKKILCEKALTLSLRKPCGGEGPIHQRKLY